MAKARTAGPLVLALLPAGQCRNGRLVKVLDDADAASEGFRYLVETLDGQHNMAGVAIARAVWTFHGIVDVLDSAEDILTVAESSALLATRMSAK